MEQQPQPYDQMPEPQGQQPGEQQQMQQLEGVPQAARKTILRHVGDGQIRSVEREQEDDRTVYEIDYRAEDGTSHTLKVDTQGKLVEKQRESE